MDSPNVLQNILILCEEMANPSIQGRFITVFQEYIRIIDDSVAVVGPALNGTLSVND